MSVVPRSLRAMRYMTLSSLTAVSNTWDSFAEPSLIMTTAMNAIIPEKTMFLFFIIIKHVMYYQNLKE